MTNDTKNELIFQREKYLKGEITLDDFVNIIQNLYSDEMDSEYDPIFADADTYVDAKDQLIKTIKRF